MKIKPYRLPLAVILVGILFSLYLQWQIPDGIFFSGDAGLKALLTQQLSAGQLRFDLVPPSETWVRDLWQKGLYPFQEPFVYHLNNRDYITFPFTFPLITAPFYALLGYRGLYIIPLLATWGTWLTFYLTCQRLKFSQIGTSVALAILILASPLSIYSAMYWEHTLAVALAFYGLSILFIHDSAQGLTQKNAVLSGVFIGSSVWFRPEFLCLVGLLVLLVFIASLSNWSKLDFLAERLNLRKFYFLAHRKWFFIASVFVTIGLFFLCNKLIYNHPLGIHAIQVVEQQTLSQRLLAAKDNFYQLIGAIVEYFPIILFPIAYLLISLLRKPGVKLTAKLAIAHTICFLGAAIVGVALTQGTNRRVYLVLAFVYFVLSLLIRAEAKLNIEMVTVYLICFLFIVGVALLVPVGAGGKQWGPRFLLILVPIISLLATNQLELLAEKTRPNILKYVGISLFSVVFLIGLHKNTYLGNEFLRQNNQTIEPVVEFLRKTPNKVIGMSHQYVAQVIEPSLSKDKVFFRAEDSKKLVQLGTALVEQSQAEFIYVCYPHRECTPPQEAPENFQFSQGDRNFKIELSKLGDFGKYPVYKAEIIKRSPTQAPATPTK
ncbi:MAG TPA: dolichol-phosphate mannosyltransferase [Cyanobacteria bacterium UBA8803]|nr:dolichol-phosphate mannosyltransferase [Cyanobacteria bacterium UBA9273]HBL62576.1 dolichol-phosphate mannosyltransferase [Cyanobacteria bacterium UBA8803]